MMSGTMLGRECGNCAATRSSTTSAVILHLDRGCGRVPSERHTCWWECGILGGGRSWTTGAVELELGGPAGKAVPRPEARYHRGICLLTWSVHSGGHRLVWGVDASSLGQFGQGAIA